MVYLISKQFITIEKSVYELTLALDTPDVYAAHRLHRYTRPGHKTRIKFGLPYTYVHLFDRFIFVTPFRVQTRQGKKLRKF
jgi:hypothetical protein